MFHDSPQKMFHSKKFKPKFSPQKLTPMAKIYKRTSYVKSYLYHLFETFKIIKLPFVRKKDVIRNKAFTEKEPDPTGTISHTMWRCSCNRYLLLTEFGGRTVSYGPSFFFLDLWKKNIRTVGDKSQNSFATESTLMFSGPYRRVRPAKLTNHSARTN